MAILTDTTHSADTVTMRPPPPVRLGFPGLYHGPDDGSIATHPAAGDATLLNGVPIVRLTITSLAGRDIVIDVTDARFLDDLVLAATIAQHRLAALGLTRGAA